MIRMSMVMASGLMLSACAERPLVQNAEPRPELAKASVELEPPPRPPALVGVASYYSQGEQTANGEKFDPLLLTAAHRTLPFGTKLRVTNVHTGRSVIVRVNDRGPFIKGRDVDVSYSAAQKIGMIDAGTATVKMEVLR